MIRRIHVQRYKSLRDVTVVLEPLSVLFGPNAAGKSNFIDALQLLSRIAGSRSLKEAFEPPYRGKPMESDTPRRAGGLMSWAASKAVGPLVQASRAARLFLRSESSAVAIRGCSRMYWRICPNSESEPTVCTAKPRTQKCSPEKFLSLPQSRPSRSLSSRTGFRLGLATNTT
jgi:hypothetical protein